MGNGSSSSQQQRRPTAEEHTYEEIQEQNSRKVDNNRFHRNCSIITLDIKPGEWRRFAEAERSKEEEEVGGRDVWWGEDDQSSRRRSRLTRGYQEEEKDWTARSQGGWDTSQNTGWRDEAVGPWATYKRCVSLDVKQIDPDFEEKSDF